MREPESLEVSNRSFFYVSAGCKQRGFFSRFERDQHLYDFFTPGIWVSVTDADDLQAEKILDAGRLEKSVIGADAGS